MTLNKRIRAIFMLLFAVPLLLDVQYAAVAWRSSPLDHYQWLWWCLVAGLLVLFWKRVRRWAQPSWRLKSPWGWMFCVMSCTAMAYGCMRSIHAVYLAGALAFLFSGIYVLYGERLFSGVSPLFVASLLGIPSTTFWFEYYIRGAGLPQGADYVKPAVGVIACVLFCLTFRPLRIDRLLFVGFLTLLAAFAVIRVRPMKKGDCFTVMFDVDRTSGWLCENLPLETHDMIFFKGAQVKQYLYIKNGTVIALSSIMPEQDIHSLHPVEICMRSGGSVIERSGEVVLEAGGRRIAALESLVASDETRYLVYTVYVGPEWSSGNFMAFRHHWRKGMGWTCYQALTAIRESAEDSREAVIDLLEAVVR